MGVSLQQWGAKNGCFSQPRREAKFKAPAIKMTILKIGGIEPNPGATGATEPECAEYWRSARH